MWHEFPGLHLQKVWVTFLPHWTTLSLKKPKHESLNTEVFNQTSLAVNTGSFMWVWWGCKGVDGTINWVIANSMVPKCRFHAISSDSRSCSVASKAVVSCVLTKFRVVGLKIKIGCVMNQGLDLFSAEILTLEPAATAQVTLKSNYLLHF